MKRISRAVFWLAMAMLLDGPAWAVAEGSAKQNEEVAVEAREDQSVVDLWQLFQESVTEDPRILAANSRSRSMRYRQSEAFGRFFPQINASASRNRTLYKVQASGVHELYNSDRMMINLSQSLYDPEVWSNYRRYKALAKQQASEFEATREEATVDLIERYFTALSAEDSLGLVEAELNATRRNLERVDSLYKKQMALVTDVLELSARVDALSAAEIEARNQVEVSREALSELIGHPVRGRLKRIGSQASFHMPAQDREYWVQQALEFNPALKARQKAVDAAEAALSQAKAGHLPKIGLDLTAQRSDIGYQNSSIPRTDTYVATIGVQVPIFSGGSTRAKVLSSYEDLMAAEHELEGMRRQVLRETRAAYYSIETGLGKISASRKALESAEKARVAAEKAFGFGVMNAVDVLNTVKEEYASRRDLLKSQYDFIMNTMVLRRWSGTLVEDDVRKINEWLVVASDISRP